MASPKITASTQPVAPEHMWATKISDNEIFEINVEIILPSPDQTREDFSKAPEIAKSIDENGQRQPIEVWRRPDGKIELVTGETRLIAIRDILKRRTIRAVFVSGTPKQRAILCGIENIQREQLNPLEEARYFARLSKTYGMKTSEIAEASGRDTFTIDSYLAVLEILPAEVLEFIRTRELPISVAYGQIIKPFRAGRLKQPGFYAKAREIINKKRSNMSAEDRAKAGALQQGKGVRGPRAARKPADRINSILSMRERGNRVRATVDEILEEARRGNTSFPALIRERLSPETRSSVAADFRWISEAARQLAGLFHPSAPVSASGKTVSAPTLKLPVTKPELIAKMLAAMFPGSIKRGAVELNTTFLVDILDWGRPTVQQRAVEAICFLRDNWDLIPEAIAEGETVTLLLSEARRVRNSEFASAMTAGVLVKRLKALSNGVRDGIDLSKL